MTTLAPLSTDFQPIIDLVVNACASPSTRSRYKSKLTLMFKYWGYLQRPPFDRQFVQRFLAQLRAENAAGFTINQTLTAVKRLAKEAHYAGLLAPEAYRGIEDIPAVKIRGTAQGSRLTEEEVLKLLKLPRAGTVRGKRDRVILELLFYAGLRREEVTLIRMEHVQMLEGRPVLLNLRGKGDRVRTIPIPEFVLRHIQEWIDAAGITDGFVCRRIRGEKTACAGQMCGKGIYLILKHYAKMIGKDEVSPHSMRRSMGTIARQKGVDLEQIQEVYGHEDRKTTISYTGGNLNIRDAVCDKLPKNED